MKCGAESAKCGDALTENHHIRGWRGSRSHPRQRTTARHGTRNRRSRAVVFILADHTRREGERLMKAEPRRTRFAQVRSVRAYMLYVGFLAVLLLVSATLVRVF